MDQGRDASAYPGTDVQGVVQLSHGRRSSRFGGSWSDFRASVFHVDHGDVAFRTL